MSARRIGDILAPILQRCVEMQPVHNAIHACHTASSQKNLIMKMRQDGIISGDEATLLIQSYGLETA